MFRKEGKNRERERERESYGHLNHTCYLYIERIKGGRGGGRIKEGERKGGKGKGRWEQHVVGDKKGRGGGGGGN